MTTCKQCRQVVVFSKQQQGMTFCCKECLDAFIKVSNQRWYLTHHHSEVEPTKLKDVMFHNQPPPSKPPSGMFGQ